MPSKPPAPSDLADKFMLRLPDGMRDRIAEEAKASGRSMNSEIVYRLEQTLLAQEHIVATADDAALLAMADTFIKRLEERGVVWRPAERGRRAKSRP